MASTYTPSLKLLLQGTGDNSGNWGALVNTDLTTLVDTAIAGYATITMANANYTLSSGNGSSANESRNMYLNVVGTNASALNVICPTVSKLYYIRNATVGGFAITLKTSAGTGISIPNGSAMVLLCDGTNVVDAVTQFSSGSFTNLAYTGTLTGGTGIVNLGSGQVYKDAAGNVGVGTVAPAQKLHVVGDIQQDNANYLRSKIAVGTSTRLLGINAGNVLYMGSIDVSCAGGVNFINGTTYMTVAAAGNVTIAAPSSGDALTVSGGVAYTGTLTGGTGIVNLGSGQVYKDAAGNVGIGIATPLARVSVENQSAADGITIRSNGFNTNKSGTTNALLLGADYQTGNNYIVAGGSSTNTSLIFYTAAGVAPAERMRIAAAGNVTIAAPSSGIGLTVNNTGGSSTALFATSSANSGVVDVSAIAGQLAIIRMAGNGTSLGTTSFDILAGVSDVRIVQRANLPLALWTNTIERLTIAAAGNVTIAAPSSGVALVVNAASGLAGATLGTISIGANATDISSTSVLNLVASGANALILSTNGSQRVVVGSAGNVTIAAPSSGNALTVSGGLRVDAAVTTVSPTGGAAGAPPAAPVGYVTINIGGTDRKIAFYS